MRIDPTLVGTVQDVTGTTVSVALMQATKTGLSFHKGDVYRVGQVGSFVRIPLGYTSLFGIVSQVGAGAAPLVEDKYTPSLGNQWLRVQLVGERGRSGKFERGLSQHPNINDPVHIVTERDLRDIYGPGDPVDFVSIGHLASAESIPALVNINKLITRHSAVVGSTGAGKSTTVASLLTSISEPGRYPGARILVLDIHGEYAKAFGDRATVLRLNPDLSRGEKPLRIPYWALSFDELVKLAFGELSDASRHRTAVADAVIALKRNSLIATPRAGVTLDTLTVDSPVPFSLNKLWFDFHQRENRTVIPNPGGANEELISAYVTKLDGSPVEIGDAERVIPPIYRTVKTTGPAPERVQWGPDTLGMRQALGALASRLRDKQFSFLFQPGDWRPDLQGNVNRDIDNLLEQWIGSAAPITILDLSGIPATILDDLVGSLLRIVYDALFWARNLPEGGRQRPLLLVLEEAHTYLGKSKAGAAALAVQRIAKEGRKYGVGLMLVSQRPSEIDATILSQCGTMCAMRLSNESDRAQIAGTSADNLKGLFDMLPVLRTGEAIVVGEAVSLPIRAMIEAPPPGRRPDSEDPRIVVPGDASLDGFTGEGGWAFARISEDYSIVARQWRLQDAIYLASTTDEGTIMQWIDTPDSSTILRFAYDEQRQVLSVEFKSGGRYEYYDVGVQVFDAMHAAASKGKYHAAQIKNRYRYARL